MQKKYETRAILLSLLTVFLLLIVMTTATFAWFSASNRQVKTQRITANTAKSEFNLEVSASPDFTGDTGQTNIVQVNSANAMMLMPVSTDNLYSFVYCPATEGKTAASFYPVTNEQYYYHGRIYMRASGTGFSKDSDALVYLDGINGGSPIIGAADGQMLNAARLGLVLSSSTSRQSHILSLSSSHNTGGAVMNTRLNGVDQPEGIVLHSSGAEITAAPDPSVYYQNYLANAGSTAAQPELFRMKIGETYTLDIYFYLEGCDPDCSNIISADMAEIGLQFYGIIS